MEQKIYEEKILKLSESNFEKVELKISELEYYSGDFLTDDLMEILKQELEDNKIKEQSGLKHFFSLSYCQGDGYMFEGNFKWKNYFVSIKHSGHYYHSYCSEIYVETISGNEAKDSVQEEFKELYHSICSKMEKKGYEIIEEDEKRHLIERAIQNWATKNEIDLGNLEVWDLDYSEEEKEGYIQIAESGDTNINGVWIKDFELKIQKILEVEIKDYEKKFLMEV